MRSLRRSPGISIAAIVTLAAGIGPTVAMFTLVYSALIQPLPYPEPERVVTPLAVEARDGQQLPPPNGEIADRIAAMRSFDLVSRISVAGGLLVGGSDPIVAFGSGVEPPFYRIFGMPIVLGRAAERAGEAVIASRLWEQRFGRRDDVLGRGIRYRDRPLTIVGVAGASYDFPYRNEIWFAMPGGPAPADEPFVDMALRLAPGVTIDDARAEVALMQQSLEASPLNLLQGRRLALQSFQEAETGHLRGPLLTLFAASALVILIACANVANLLLAAGTARQREMALRRAIGASPWQVTRMALAESSWLAALGLGGGVLLAYWTVPVILANAPDVITRRTDFTLSWPVLAFAAALAALATLTFGLAPALRLSRVPAIEALNSVNSTLSGRQTWIVGGFVAVQAAVGVVLIVATALMLVSLSRLAVPLAGLSPDQTSVVRIDIAQTRGSSRRIADAVAEQIVVPSGGRLVAASGLPLHPVLPVRVALAGQSEAAPVPLRSISPGYFKRIGQRLVMGRDFSTADRAGAPDVAIVSETLARRVADAVGRGAIGASLTVTLAEGTRTLTVVGIAADVRASVASRPGPEVYVPLAQVAFATRGSWLYVIGSRAEAATFGPAVRQLVRQIDPETPVGEPSGLDQQFRDRLALHRFRSALIVAFGTIALLLAAAGIFAVVAYAVIRRTRELAVRIAVGATTRDVSRAIVPGVAAPVAVGLSLGLVAATQLAPFIRSMLFYEVSATSPGVYAVAAAAFVSAAALATWLPMRRAWRLNPAETLRRE
jgi:predicted permease